MPLSTVRPIDRWIGAPDPRQAWSSGVLTANVAALTAFQVFRPVTVTTARFHVLTQSGNMEIGIYEDDGAGNLTLVGTTGSFACPAAGASSQALSASATLVPGRRYYVADARDNSTMSLYRSSMTVASTFPHAELLFTVKVAMFPLPATTTYVAGSATSYNGAFIYFT